MTGEPMGNGCRLDVETIVEGWPGLSLQSAAEMLSDKSKKTNLFRPYSRDCHPCKSLRPPRCECTCCNSSRESIFFDQRSRRGSGMSSLEPEGSWNSKMGSLGPQHASFILQSLYTDDMPIKALSTLALKPKP